MSSMPPLSEVIDAGLNVILPAFAVTAIAGYGIPKLLGRRFDFVAAAIAVLAGSLTANYLRGIFDFRFEPETPLSVVELFRGFNRAFWYFDYSTNSAATDGLSSPKPGRYWIPWAVALTVISGMAVRSINRPMALGFFAKFCLSIAAAKIVVPASLVQSQMWVLWLTALVIFAEWLLMELLIAKLPKGSTYASLGIAALGGAVVLLHAHSARLTDSCVLIASVLFGVSLVSRLNQTDVAEAVPFGAVSLSAVMVAGHYETFSDVPTAAFAVPALSPLAIGLLLLAPTPWIKEWRGWMLSAILIGIPTLIAIVLAGRAESLSF